MKREIKNETYIFVFRSYFYNTSSRNKKNNICTESNVNKYCT